MLPLTLASIQQPLAPDRSSPPLSATPQRCLSMYRQVWTVLDLCTGQVQPHQGPQLQVYLSLWSHLAQGRVANQPLLDNKIS